MRDGMYALSHDGPVSAVCKLAEMEAMARVLPRSGLLVRCVTPFPAVPALQSCHASDSSRSVCGSVHTCLRAQILGQFAFGRSAWQPLRHRSLVIRSQSDAVEKEEKVPSIGFLGLGIMGTAMARNLVNAGYDVTVWNRTATKSDSLVKEGAKRGETPEQTAAACDITFAMLADPAGAMEVACGAEGAVNGLGPGKGYVDVSTVDADTSKLIANAVRAAGAEFLEAPVSGSKKPAEDGTLIFLTAGDKALYEKAAPFLDIMGKSRFYLGEVGNGAAMKLVVNMVMGSMMASFSEGLVLGRKVGLDPNTIIEVIGQGAISAPMFAMKGPSMVKNSYAPAFPLKHQQKDLRLALAMADELGQPIPVAAAVNEVYKRAKATGLGDQDFSAVIEAINSEGPTRT